MVELNLIGLIAATQAALPAMRSRRQGDIVNIASTAGRTAGPGSAGYAATKFGVVGFSEALRKELVADHVRVTVIEPGMAATELREHIGHPGTKAAAEGRATKIRQLQSEDIANAVLYAVTQPPHVRIEEILMRPTDQDW
jgi:NADP-dependent 3-hydroxy acid dehydrogenase YdfG